jgi:hypothetical protein
MGNFGTSSNGSGNGDFYQLLLKVFAERPAKAKDFLNRHEFLL